MLLDGTMARIASLMGLEIADYDTEMSSEAELGGDRRTTQTSGRRRCLAPGRSATAINYERITPGYSSPASATAPTLSWKRSAWVTEHNT
jgi:hypothetical protein